MTNGCSSTAAEEEVGPGREGSPPPAHGRRTEGGGKAPDVVTDAASTSGAGPPPPPPRETAVDDYDHHERSPPPATHCVGRRRRVNGEKTENYMSFKLCLHVAIAAQHNTMANYDGSMIVVACPELMMALKRGEWLRPDESSCLLTPTNDGGHNRRKGLLLRSRILVCQCAA